MSSCSYPFLKAICALYFITGIKATKIIRNLQFVNSFGLSSLAFLLFWFFHFCNSGPVQTGRPRPGRGGGWESESLRGFNTRQESGNGTRKLRTGSRSVLQYGTRIRDWVPLSRR